MGKTLNNSTLYILCFALFCGFFSYGQVDSTQTSTPLISFIQQLETKFDIKFSYADADVNQIQIAIPQANDLPDILTDLQQQTNFEIQKLNERYYTISIGNTVDVCGIVFDNLEQNIIVGATVQIVETDRAIITDFDGSFSFTDVPINATIRIKHLGFETLYEKAHTFSKKTPCTTILLQQFYNELEEVVVYDFLTKGLVQAYDASIQMNTGKFGIIPGLIEPDVLQTVQALPGVKSIDETVSDINIRGGSNDQNLILWNGIKMYQSGHFFGLISAFNPHLTDKITLIKNGTSSKYGDGVSGIIDMRTKNEITDEYYGGAGFNLISGDIFGQVPLSNKLALQFSGRRSVTDFLSTATFETFFTKAFLNDQIKDGISQISDVERDDTFYFYDFTGKVLYDINSKHKLRFSFININNSLDYSERSIINLTKTTSTLDQSNFSFGGNIESEWNAKFSTELNTYQTRYNLDAGNIGANGEQAFFQNNLVVELGVRLNSNFQITPLLNWGNGYQLNETSIANATNVSQPPFQSNVKDIIKTHAYYSELGYVSENENLHATGGLRLSYYDNPNTFTQFLAEPRLNVNYAFTRAFKATLLGEFKSQAINQVLDLEQNFLGVEKRRWLLSNGDDLPVVKSKQASFGLNYDTKNLYVGIEGFYKEVDGVNTDTQGFQNQDQFKGDNDEIGSYTVKGVEFLINRKTDSYSIWASYAYNLNNYNFSEHTPAIFPNNLDIRHTTTVAGTYTVNKLKFGVGLNYHTGKPITEPNSETPLNDTVFPSKINFDEPNSTRLTEYLRADASVVYDFNISTNLKASTGVSVLNFTDRSNILNRYYRVNADNELETIESYSLGITPNYTFRLMF